MTRYVREVSLALWSQWGGVEVLKPLENCETAAHAAGTKMESGKTRHLVSLEMGKVGLHDVIWVRWQCTNKMGPLRITNDERRTTNHDGTL